MVRRKIVPEMQLSLFEQPEPSATESSAPGFRARELNTTAPGFENGSHLQSKKEHREKDPSVIDFIKARYEHGPEMTQEEYKRWIKILVNASIKRLE